MYHNKRIGVVVPAYNEEKLIAYTVNGIPDYVDHIVVVNDVSKDRTAEILEDLARKNESLVVIHHEENQGVGGAIASGYKWCRDNEVDVAVVMAGDGQMDPNDLPEILKPVVNDEADYSKGNRLFTGEAFKQIPKVRYFGNSVLSLLTKIASGYWHVADSQTGYTAINRRALETLNWDKMYKRYGQPNDLLVKLNIFDFRVRDVPVKPVYNIGEKSGIRIGKVIFTIPKLLLRLFLLRMKEKYIIRNFHPLIFFYLLGFVFFLATLFLSVRMFIVWADTGLIPKVNALAAMFSFMSSSLFTLFAMWFDMESNKHLH